MRINDTISIYAGAEQQNVKNMEQQEKGKKGSIFAGDLNDNLISNRIEQRRQQAQKKAMKVISDAWAGDKAIDDDIVKRREHIEALRKEMKTSSAGIKEIEETQKQLQEEYGVASDSKEQQDLELLRRKRDLLSGKGGQGMTQEELLYVEKLEAEGLTEYQQRQLELDDEKQIYQDSYDESLKSMKQEAATITAIKLERLKYSPMVDAKKQAEEIEQAAREEILGMLAEDGMDHIEKEQQERQEQAQELKEQKEEQEAFIEAQKEKKEENEERLEELPLEEILYLNQTRTDIRKEVQNIVDKMKLVAEDIKGAAVDENV